jgi:photosystem II stability/assembly factor-like uncharacterized protein
MLLVGTKNGLLDLDTGGTLVEGHAVTALTPSPRGWHALLDRQVVIHFDQGEVTIFGKLRVDDGQSLAVLPDLTDVVGRTGARLAIVGTEVQDLTAFEQVPGRDHWKNPANPTPDTRSMATSGEDLWVNVHVGGLWHSVDRGESWQGVIEPDADVHEVRALNASVTVASAVGFGWSQDGGKSWSWSTDELHARYLRAVCIDDETVYVSASDGPFTNRGAVYRARLGSAFVRCEQGLPEWFPANIDTGHLDAAGGRVAIGFRDEVYVSEDAGESWRAYKVPDVITAVRLGRN